MDKISKYILKEFLPSFFTIFFILGTIVSLIFIISISNMTSNIKITFLELFEMYLLSLPQIIFLSLSISFFIASVNVYSKFSETFELIALFSLGFKPFKVLKPIAVLALIFTIINVFILFISIPYSKAAFNNFKAKKAQEAKFNFQSAKISQQLGEWSLFASSAKNKHFNKVYLFNSEKKEFIFANEAKLYIKNRVLSFKLQNGRLYDFNKSFQIKYQNMQINQIIPTTRLSLLNFKNYFKINKKLFTHYLPFALIPIALLFFIPVFSFFHPRLHKNHSLIYSILLLSIYIVFSFVNKKFEMALIIPFIFLIIGGIFYKWKIKF